MYTDIDECEKGTDQCNSTNQVCENSMPPEFYRCKCKDGYRLIPDSVFCEGIRN